MKRNWFLFFVLVTITGGLWAQDAADNSPTNTVAFTVEVTYMTQGGTKMTESISVFASDPRAAERDAEAQFKQKNSRSTFIRATAKVDEAYVPNRSESTSSVSSSSRSVSPNPEGKMLFSVKVTYMTQGGTKRTDTMAVQASDPRAAEREAEAQFKKTNSRSTFIRAVTE